MVKYLSGRSLNLLALIVFGLITEFTFLNEVFKVGVKRAVHLIKRIVKVLLPDLTKKYAVFVVGEVLYALAEWVLADVSVVIVAVVRVLLVCLNLELFLELDGLFTTSEALNRVYFAPVIGLHERIQLQLEGDLEALFGAAEQPFELLLELYSHTL